MAVIMKNVVLGLFMLLCVKTAAAQNFFWDLGGVIGVSSISIKNNDRIFAETINRCYYISAKTGLSFSSLKPYLSLRFDAFHSPFHLSPELSNKFLTEEKQRIEFTLFRILPGAGLKWIPPFRTQKHCPIFQMELNLDCFHWFFGGALGNSEMALDKGVNTTLGLGWRFSDECWITKKLGFGADALSVFVEIETMNHDFFNKDFTLDDGRYHPFVNMESKINCVMLSLSWEIGIGR